MESKGIFLRESLGSQHSLIRMGGGRGARRYSTHTKSKDGNVIMPRRVAGEVNLDQKLRDLNTVLAFEGPPPRFRF